MGLYFGIIWGVLKKDWYLGCSFGDFEVIVFEFSFLGLGFLKVF